MSPTGAGRVHDLAANLIRYIADNAPSSEPSNGIVIAICGVATAAIGAITTAYVTLKTRAPAPVPVPPSPHPDPLNSDTVHDDDPVGTELAAKVAAYQRFLYRNRVDPTLIQTGEEAIDSVRIPD